MTFGFELIAYLYFTSEVYAAGIKQWTVRDMPNFEDLILKLGWMIWAIIYYAHHSVCLYHRLILCNLVWGLVLKGEVLNHVTVVFMKLFFQHVVCCLKNIYGYMTMLKRVYVYACIIALISSTSWNEVGTSRDMI